MDLIRRQFRSSSTLLAIGLSASILVVLEPGSAAAPLVGHRALARASAFPAGTIFVAQIAETDPNGPRPAGILAIDPASGAQELVAIGFGPAEGVAIESAESLVVATSVPAQVFRVDLTTGHPSLLASGGNLQVLADIAVAPTGEILVVDPIALGGALIEISPVDGTQTVIRSALALPGLSGPTGLDVTEGGSVFVALPRAFGVTGPGAVYQIDPQSGQTIQAFEQDLLTFPTDVVLAPNGKLYVTNSDGQFGSGSIVSIDPQTGQQELVTSGGFLVDPNRLTVDLNGDLIVGDPNGPPDDPPATGAIVHIDVETHAQSLVSSGGLFLYPFGVAVMPESADDTLDVGPAGIWVGLKNSDAVGTRFDLKAEAFVNGLAVASGEILNVPGGSSGFNNAILRTIPMTMPQPATVGSGDAIDLRLSVRIGATGHRSGTARLWYNDSAATSGITLVIGGSGSPYFLLSGQALQKDLPGPGPKNTVDVFVSRTGGNPYKVFGTWSVVVQ